MRLRIRWGVLLLALGFAWSGCRHPVASTEATTDGVWRECSWDWQCGKGQQCVDNHPCFGAPLRVCAIACRTDKDCPAGLFCNGEVRGGASHVCDRTSWGKLSEELFARFGDGGVVGSASDGGLAGPEAN